jgi:hypothetical protein
MAQKVSVNIVDDLDGSVLGDGQGETIVFGLDGAIYEIDLSDKNAAALRKALEKYTAAARRTNAPARGRGRPKGSGSSTRRDPAQTAQIKSWAKDNGFKVPERGRLSNDLLAAYEAAHAS